MTLCCSNIWLMLHCTENKTKTTATITATQQKKQIALKSIWKSKTRVTSTNYGLQVQIHELRGQIHELRVQIHESRVQIHEL